jgi:hypothetical protein
MKFAYADPPYLGNGKTRYKEHPEAHIWDDKSAHIGLIRRLVEEYPDGWALSCNPSDLRWVLPECPEDCRVGAWVKTFHQIRPTTTQYAWEPVIFRGGRSNPKRVPMVRDWLSCPTTRNKGTIGAKPDAFNEWILAILGYDPNLDTLDDIFPGSNGMLQELRRSAITVRLPLQA